MATFGARAFGKWICKEMKDHKIKCREIAAAAQVCGSAVDNYRVGACYPRMPKLLGIVKLIASRREQDWQEVWIELGELVIADHDVK